MECMANSAPFEKRGDDAFPYFVHDVAFAYHAQQSVAPSEIDGQIPQTEEDSCYNCTAAFRFESVENAYSTTQSKISTEPHQH